MAALALAQGAAFLLYPSAALVALGLWWNSNTISHNFIHRPFFRRRAANALFSAYLSVLLGIPQSLWRERHLAHHAGQWGRRSSLVVCRTREFVPQIALILALWAFLAARSPRFFLSAYLPGYLAGLGLCALHGYYEHARGVTSHYGRLYNTLFFNDGYHAEHHAHPALHWTRLPDRIEPAARSSAWPAPLRWMEGFGLEGLERLALRWSALRRFVVRAHERAFQLLACELPAIERVAVVGGGMFPRTALILRRLFPAARISIVDASRANLEQARRLLGGGAEGIEFVHSRWTPSGGAACDLLVIPLSFQGDREAVYAQPPAPAVAVHDWIWRRRGSSRIVSVLLLKRINLVRR